MNGHWKPCIINVECGYKYLRCEKLLKICQIVPTLQIREHLVNILFCSAVSCSFMNASIHFLWTPNYAMTEYRVILLTANFSIRLKPAPPQNTIEELGDDEIIAHSMPDLPLVGTPVGTDHHIGGSATGPTKSSSS